MFTDGAADVGVVDDAVQEIAGWGAIFLAETVGQEDSQLEWLGALWGPVCVAVDDPAFLGAERATSPVAEHSGALAVLKLIARIMPDTAEVVLMIDASHTVDVVNFECAVRQNRCLAKSVRVAVEALRLQRRVRCYKISGHSGIPGNEFADLAATLGMQGECSDGLTGRTCVPLDPPLPLQLCLEAELFWSDALDRANAAPPQIPQHDESRDTDTTLVLASANVLTMHPATDASDAPSARRSMLAASFAHARFAVVGVQEARSRSQWIGTVGSFFVVASAAAKGHAGTELWFARSMGIDASSATRVVSSARLLVVRAPLCNRPCLFVAAHAPPGVPGWWAGTVETICRANRDRLPIIMLVDANAHVGSCVTQHVGQSGAEQEDECGAAFHEALVQLQLAAPATLLDGAGPTWLCPRTGRWKRCDYVLVPLEWTAACFRPRTDLSGMLAIGTKEDHRVTSVSVRLSGSTARKVATGKRYCRLALKRAEVRAAVKEAWESIPALPANWCAESAERALTQVSMEVLQAEAPPSAPAPRAHWITDDTWALLRGHATERRCFFRALERRNRLRLSIVVSLWACAAVQLRVARARGEPVWSLLACEFADRATSRAEHFVRTAYAMALSRVGLDLAAAKAAKAVALDKANWVKDISYRAAEDWRPGGGKRLWDMVKKASPKKRNRNCLPVVVDENGEIVQTKEEEIMLWERRFAAEFGGRATFASPEQLHSRIAADTFELPTVVPSEAWSRVDWMCELATAVAGAKAGTLTGTDDIPIEFMRASGVNYLRQLATVAVATSWSPVPSTWRNGVMVPVPRKPGTPLSAANVRGVLAGSHPGKAVAKVCRSQVVGALQDCAGQWQHGAVPNGGTEFPLHSAKLFLKLSKLNSVPAAALFTDIKGAFYSIVQELALGACMTVGERTSVFAAAGMDVSTIDALNCQIELHEPIIQRMKVGSQWQRLLVDWHRHASFTVRGGQRAVLTPVGTRPGDPLADLVFALAFVVFQQRLHDLMLAVGAMPSVVVPGRGIFQRDGEHEADRTVFAGLPTYMDDLVCLLQADSPQELLATVALVASSLREIAHGFGLTINFCQRKTEVIVALAGAGAKLCRAEIESFPKDDDGTPLLQLVPSGVLRLVETYQHLGTRASAGLSQLPEIAARVTAARQADAALHRVLADKRLPSEARSAVGEACVQTRLLYAAGTWDVLSATQFEMLHCAMMRPFRKAAGAHREPAAGEVRRSNAEVLSALQVAGLKPRLVAARARYAARASLHGSDWLLALLRSPAGLSWRSELLLALATLQTELAPQLDYLPDPRVDPAAWEKTWTAEPLRWKRLIRAFLKQASCKEPGDDVVEAVEQLPLSWRCIHCDAVFANRRAMLAHARVKHGVRTLSRRVVLTQFCPACGTDFHCRLRAIRHIETATSCNLAMQHELLPMWSSDSVEVCEANAADQELVKRCRRLGRNPIAGPPPVPP